MDRDFSSKSHHINLFKAKRGVDMSLRKDEEQDEEFDKAFGFALKGIDQRYKQAEGYNQVRSSMLNQMKGKGNKLLSNIYLGIIVMGLVLVPLEIILRYNMMFNEENKMIKAF